VESPHLVWSKGGAYSRADRLECPNVRHNAQHDVAWTSRIVQTHYTSKGRRRQTPEGRAAKNRRSGGYAAGFPLSRGCCHVSGSLRLGLPQTCTADAYGVPGLRQVFGPSRGALRHGQLCRMPWRPAAGFYYALTCVARHATMDGLTLCRVTSNAGGTIHAFTPA
jgi:hypothetical protein